MGTGVSEILVTGPKSPKVKNTSDLASQEIYVRKSSSYYASLKAFNHELKDRGKNRLKLCRQMKTLKMKTFWKC